VIFKKIEETLALGGTGLLMQGGTIPISESTTTRISSARSRSATDSALGARDPAHLATIRAFHPGDSDRLRDASLVPRRRAAKSLVDRVREIIPPKKTKTGVG